MSGLRYEVFDQTPYGRYHGEVSLAVLVFDDPGVETCRRPRPRRCIFLTPLLDPRVAAATALVGAAGLLYCVRKLERQLGERTTVLMGTMSAFVFAAQMVNFPVGPVVSGHLLGGVLAAVLLGHGPAPW